MKNKPAFTIKGSQITEEYIFDKATKLTEISESMELITNILDLVVCSVNSGDQFTAPYFLKAGGLSNVIDNLGNINRKIVEISNDLCVDEIEGQK